MASAFSGVPEKINIQGRLTDEKGVNKTGNVNLTLSLYTDAISGSLLWQEVQAGVNVTNGNFQTFLGKGAILPGSAGSLTEVFSSADSGQIVHAFRWKQSTEPGKESGPESRSIGTTLGFFSLSYP